MGWFGFGGGTRKCCCGAGNPCVLLSDSFDRSDDTDLGGDWNEEAGAAAISAGAVVLTSNNTRVISTDVNPDGPYMHVTATFRLASGASTAKLYLSYANLANHLYCTITASTLTVGKHGGASQTVSATFLAGGTYQVTVCFNGTVLVATASGYQAVLSGVSATGTRWGFGCGTATVTIDDFTARKVSANCSRCDAVIECGSCCNAGQPATVVLDFTAITSTADECDNCAALAAEYVLPFLGRLSFPPGCMWEYEDKAFCTWPCAHANPAVCLGGAFPASDGNYTLTVRFRVDDFCTPTASLQLSPNARSGTTCDVTCLGNTQTLASWTAPAGSWGGDCTVPLVLTRNSQEVTTVDPAANLGGPCEIVFPETITVRRAA